MPGFLAPTLIELTSLGNDGEWEGVDAAGQRISVRGFLLGDQLRVLSANRKHGGWRARDCELVAPGCARASVPCEVQAECGGCGLMPLARESQAQAKLARLARLLEEQGLAVAPLTLVHGAQSVGYRNRLRLQVMPSGELGYFNHHKSFHCAVLLPALRARLSELRRLAAAEPQLFRDFAHVELRSPDLDGRPGLLLAGKPLGAHRESTHGEPDQAAWLAVPGGSGQAAWLAVPGEPEQAARLAAAHELRERLPEYLLGLEGSASLPWQRRALVDGLWTYVPLDGFVQINSEVNALLVAALRDRALEQGCQRVLELYAGSGNFSLPLAAAGLQVTAVELHAASITAFRAAAKEQQLDCQAFAQSAQADFSQLIEPGAPFDLALVDAPRGGAGRSLGQITAMRPKQVALCSCNPASLARDLRQLADGGYTLQHLTAFDMFPHTQHLECLVWVALTPHQAVKAQSEAE